MNIKQEVFSKITELAAQQERKVEFALVDDLMKAEESLKNALLNYGELRKSFEKAKNDFKIEADKAYNVALKYNSQANDLGLKAMDNPFFKSIDGYLASDLYRNLNK